VIASISRNAVQIRLVHVWIKDQRRMVWLFMLESKVSEHNKGRFFKAALALGNESLKHYHL
jgi:hypothetical protein